jgi:hypothetical protein
MPAGVCERWFVSLALSVSVIPPAKRGRATSFIYRYVFGGRGTPVISRAAIVTVAQITSVN